MNLSELKNYCESNIPLLIIIFVLLIILGLILFVKCNKQINAYKKQIITLNQDVKPLIVKEATNKSQGNGVFANKKFKTGDIIEICPNIIQPCDDFKGLVYNYLFSNYTEDNIHYCVLAFGYGSMYNHSETPNASWIIEDKTNFTIKALKDINKGEEIFVSYGSEYWDSRGLLPN